MNIFLVNRKDSFLLFFALVKSFLFSSKKKNFFFWETGENAEEGGDFGSIDKVKEAIQKDHEQEYEDSKSFFEPPIFFVGENMFGSQK